MPQVKVGNIVKAIKRGNSKYTKSFCRLNKGEYPVYSANNNEPLGFLDKYDFDGKYMTISINGLAGYIKILDGKFSITADRVVCIPKENISIDFLKYKLEDKLRKISKGRKGPLGKNEFSKLTPQMIADVYIDIPVNKDGVFDLAKQNEIVSEYQQIEQQKLKISNLLNELSNINVSIPLPTEVKQVLPSFLFTPTNGNSELTKTYCINHKGIYPVYSGNTQGKYARIDSFEYDGEYLTWAKDGIAGLMMYHNEKFSLTGHRGILIPTENCRNIDLKYIKYILEPIFRKNIKGRLGDLGKNEYTTLNSDMIKKMKDRIPVPVKENGEFDMEKQKEIASKYEQVEMIKKNLSEKIARLMKVSVE